MHPKLHLSPDKNWCNDPVGFIYYQGQYHLFYQYFPYGCTWGTMHWYHAVSKDLIHWQNLGIALYPSKYYDANGCFSGSSIEVDGKMYIYYTSVKYLQPNPENIHKTLNDAFEASQSMLISKDGIHFDNINQKRLIIPAFKENEIGHPTHTRDPKVWFYNGKYYMVIVSKYFDDNHHGQGQLLFYTSDDAINWSYQNNYRGVQLGDMWECPDIFTVNQQQLLIMSPERTETHGYPSHARITTCYFNHENCTMSQLGELRFLDYGRDLYAPQTALDQDGNRIFVGWMRMPVKAQGDWRGLFTMPRIIEYHDNHIYTDVHSNIKNQFIVDTQQFDYQKPTMIHVCLKHGDSINIGGYVLTYQDCLLANRENVFIDCDEDVDLICQTPPIDHCELDIYIDQYIIETYVNHGYYVLSHIVYHLDNTIQCNCKYEIKTVK